MLKQSQLNYFKEKQPYELRLIQQHIPNKNNGDSNISVKMIHCDMKCREVSTSRVSGRVCVCELRQNVPTDEWPAGDWCPF